ncbi:ATP-binding protein [uncultured Sphingomonas sp.]|uniref:ATP-binding protein n=1 Tax=uncultured Sphingomonas sp. TaxID=158754 RepID=UPI0035CAFB31
MSGEVEEIGSVGNGPPWRTITLIAMAILGAVTLAALVITVGGANRERDRALVAQGRSYDVMIVARTLAGTIARSEASLGRYVTSADQSLGQLYFDQWRSAATQIAYLDRLTTGDPAQQRRIDSLRRAYVERGDELSLIALSTRYVKNAQALALYYKARDASSLQLIDRSLARIIKGERTILDRRTSAAMRLVERSTTAAVGLAVFGGLLVLGAILLGWYTLRTLGESAAARAEADAAGARADELAAAVRAATDELRVQEAKLRQVQKMDAVGQLTGGIAHDFNNMLAVVLGGLELARRNIGKESAMRHLDSATEGAVRAAALTRRLLAFSREEALKPEAVEPSALVAGMSDLLDRTLGDAVTIRVRDEAAGWRVHADRVQLENALLNLAVNARDAMNGRGDLMIVTGAATLSTGQVGQCAGGEYVTFAVSDSGCGMTPEIAERVFEPFFTTKPVGKGTGLGLSQIFGFVRQQDGEVGIESAPGRGTTVTLYLPRHRGGQSTATSIEDASAAGTAPTPLKVLVVEDDPRVLAATMGALQELGHVGVACDDPFQAPRIVAADPGIELVISDVLMPRQTGPEMIAGLTARHPTLAVLYVTGYAGDAGGASEFGGHNVLRKPFTLVAIERAIAAAMADRLTHPEQIAAE